MVAIQYGFIGVAYMRHSNTRICHGARKVVKSEKRDDVVLVALKRPEASSAYSPEEPFVWPTLGPPSVMIQ